MVENNPVNNPLLRDRDGDERMTGTDDDLVDVKPIKIYPFLYLKNCLRKTLDIGSMRCRANWMLKMHGR